MHPEKLKRRPSRNHKNVPHRHNYRKTETDQEDDINSGGKSYQKALQCRDRHLDLAKEAVLTGDRVAAESHLQHADHYSRVISSFLEKKEESLSVPSDPVSALTVAADEEGERTASSPRRRRRHSRGVPARKTFAAASHENKELL